MSDKDDLDDDNYGLTEQEIAALADGDEEDEQIDASAQILADLEAAADEDIDDPIAAIESQVAEQLKAEADAKTATADDEEFSNIALEAQLEIAARNAVLPENVETDLAAIATKREELDAQFDDGDLTTKEHREAIKALDAQERELNDQVSQAKFAAKMRDDVSATIWQKQINGFFSKPENDWYKENEVALNALDALVIKMGNESPDMKGTDVLRIANEQMRKAFNLPDKAAAQQKDVKAPAKAKPNLPPILANLPAANITETGDNGKFAVLDRLAESNPDLYEERMKMLTPAEEKAYLAMSG